jgi:osmotically-inducible protein OsmY
MTYKTDEELKSEVLYQLGWDSRLNPAEIGVALHKGIVTLTGTVSNYAEKIAAKEAAHRARGVLDVANEIEVRATIKGQQTDADLARAIRHALDWDVFVPSEQIHSTVTNGWVTLDGQVESYRERLDAERVITHLQGVRGVSNQIIVAAPVNPARMQELIENVLEVRADREAQRIKVNVENGEVTVTGAVKSWDEKNAILGAISHAPGVTAVHDHLFIDFYDMRFESAAV